ncbi:4-hydroxy-tetrahydrodipicolinate synthase [Alkalibacter saccharofermentans]|uniref:4-hydroxy-tetrahydrodipicolinate synthase n=1 Tax=Alkalibacter saccharofermentans DSM 14828 TaxID=1120975 RepID=A0A1M4XPI5_9FIRM|nr:4-hydroxy-tetrahydrodipicolinate synthase [Alkalibacter saccharofermentans]SHE95132.1 4-hydroxy-tetrahydrodipicolinate synthase [Alkalibacter saccharofermentans DSM 14828]
MSVFKGSGVAIVTPFKDNKIDYPRLEQLIEWHIKEGTDAIIICGTTGETPCLSDEEQQDEIKFAVDVVKGRIPVIAGTGSNSTFHAVEMSKYADQVGADAVLVMNPYYNKGTQKGIVKHFEAVASSVSCPVIVYNVPSRTGLNISVDTMVELSKIKNITAVKEASGDILQVAEIARLCGEDFAIYSGNDNQVVPILSLGGIGVISVSANIIPKDMHDMVAKYLSGDVKGSLSLQLKMNGLNDALFIEANPIPIKAALKLMGMDTGEVRMPLTEMEEDHLKILESEMKAYGIL